MVRVAVLDSRFTHALMENGLSMRIPTIQGLIDRRILVNYRIDPDVVAKVLPKPFRPKLVHGNAIGGICMIRLKHLRPKGMPTCFGIRSENAAHRYAVEWDDDGQQRQGVFIPRRDTTSRLNTVLGGRIFPGEHHHARFDVEETDERFHVSFTSDDQTASVRVNASVASQLTPGSLFESVDEVSRFFEQGSAGYSVTNDPMRFDGLELRCHNWQVQPLDVHDVSSSHFEDHAVFPQGSVTFDCALLMRVIEHEWHSLADVCCVTPNA